MTPSMRQGMRDRLDPLFCEPKRDHHKTLVGVGELRSLLDDADRLESDLARARAENERLRKTLERIAKEGPLGWCVDDAIAALATTTEDKST